MGQLTLDALTTQVLDYAPGKSPAAVARAANLAIREFYMVAGPMKRWTLTTTAPYSTGTVAIAQGATAITLTGGTWAAGTTNQLIRCSGDDTWYGFTRVTGTTGTLDSGFAGTTLTVGTYEVVYAYYDIPTDILGIQQMWRANETPIHRAADDQFPLLIRASTEPDEPRHYAMVKSTHATNSALRVMMIPYPDAVYSFMATGKVRATQFANSAPTTEYTGFPEELDEILLYGTLFYIMGQRDKAADAAWWVGLWKDGLKAAAAHGMRGAVFEPEQSGIEWRNDGPIVTV